MIASLLLISCVTQAPEQDRAPQDPFVRYELQNGIRVIHHWVADAERQTSMTLLPAGLLSDAPGRAQYAHLLEHMLIYRVDQKLLEQPGLTFNGETTSQILRLDTYAEPALWEQSIQLQAQWLAGRRATFSPEVLAREQEKIRTEEETTVRAGFVGKWAQAAFSQIVLAGSAHASVHADVAGADLTKLRECAEQRVRIGPDLCFVSVGPADPGQLRPVLERELGQLQRTPAPESGESAAPIYNFGAREATWDLAAQAYLEWYALPGASAHERSAAMLLGTRLNQLLYMSSTPLLSGGKVVVDPLFSTAAGPGIMIIVSLAAETTLDTLQTELHQRIAQICQSKDGLPPLAMSILNQGLQLSALPPWDTLRKRVRGSPAAAFVEANVVLGLINLEFSSGYTLPELASATRNLKSMELEELSASIFASKSRNSLLLRARKD